MQTYKASCRLGTGVRFGSTPSLIKDNQLQDYRYYHEFRKSAQS